ncbi:C-type lectin lectoxin-Lio2-like [Biomphalaria glabrata]|uniref:C-type lectin lectoxin-Lio2-like n=1 Tax=Biomphalaria glabrata TaxID=6526 RepID=A0A9W2YS76_BIOGL|nr:C-type lectin lectoxin-Lio2-like [Biomphalaria glabrata]
MDWRFILSHLIVTCLERCLSIPCFPQDNDSLLLDGQCYKIFYTMLNWQDSQMECFKNFFRGILAEPRTNDEIDKLWNLLKSKSINTAWIGANDINKESNFIWSSDNSSFLNSTWMLSQPDDSGKNEDCVEIRTDRESKYTNDNQCTVRSHHLCQIAITNTDYRLYVAAIPGQSNLKHGLLQVTSNSTDVIHVRCKVQYTQNVENITILFLLPGTAANFNLEKNVFLASTDVYSRYVEVNSSQPVTIVLYIKDQSWISSTLVYPVRMYSQESMSTSYHLQAPSSHLKSNRLL